LAAHTRQVVKKNYYRLLCGGADRQFLFVKIMWIINSAYNFTKTLDSKKINKKVINQTRLFKVSNIFLYCGSAGKFSPYSGTSM